MEGEEALSFIFVCLTKLDWRSPLGYCVGLDLLVCVCICVWENGKKETKLRRSPVCAREDHLTCFMYEGLKLSFKRVEGPLHTKYETCDRHIVTHENTWQSSFAACSLQPATPTHNTKQVCFASRNLACSAVQGGVHLCVYASDQKNVWILQ